MSGSSAIVPMDTQGPEPQPESPYIPGLESEAFGVKFSQRYVDTNQEMKLEKFNEVGGKQLDCNTVDPKKDIKQSLLTHLKATADDACWKKVTCDEDKQLFDLQKRYNDIASKQAAANNNCAQPLPECLKDFNQDRHINYLRSKMATLSNLSFNFLHRVCDDVSQNCDGNGDDQRIPENMIACSGIDNPRALFFHDPAIASLGRQIACAAERNGNTPSARGFAAELYPIGTLAQSSDGKQLRLYVNVCTWARDCGKRTKVVRWIPANLCEIAAYRTANELKQRIRARKRELLGYAREFVTLQMKMGRLRPAMVINGQRMQPQVCLPNHNASAVVQLGLKRMKAKMLAKQQAAEIAEFRQEVQDSQMALCGRPAQFMMGKKKKSKKKKGKKKK